jgi:RNA polymerase sigma-70 factor (ECF subfamily)
VAEGTDTFLNELEDPASAISQQWDREHDQHVFRQLLSVIEPDFTTATWLAFRRSALEGLSAAAVAAELGISENAVLLAKSRVLKRLRAEAAGLVD